MNPDGAAWHHAVITAGMRGQSATRHGAPDRWDWGVTANTMQAALQRHERLRALAESLTPEQRAAVWSSADPRAKEMRRFVR